MSKHIELAKKLKALVDRGVDGEQTTAETMLNALMAKHKITIEEIEGEKLMDYFFNLEKHEHRLWNQVVKHVNYSIKCFGEFPVKIIKEYSLGGNYMITCTASEYVEIEAKLDFYKKLYNEELDVFYYAFLKANDLLVDNPNKTEDKEMTLEEYQKWKRTDDMSKKIKVGQFYKQLK